MVRSKEMYVINVHFPEDESEKLELRKRMGNAYVEFIKGYIMNLPISDNKKNELYLKVIDKLIINIIKK